MKKILFISLAVATVIAACKKEETFEGPSLNDLYGAYSLVRGLDISDRSVDFSTGETTFFTAAFSKNVDWTLRIKGLTSGSVKEITGFSNALDVTNALWNGTTSRLPMFKAETCAVELIITSEADTLRDTLEVTGTRVNPGFLLSDFESGLNGQWNNFVQSGANMSFSIQDSDHAAQGSHYFDIGGVVNWDWLIGMLNIPGSAYGNTYFPLSSNPNDVYFNSMLYNPQGQTNGLMLFQFREDDNGDGVYSENIEDMYSIQIALSDTGWQQVSARYADLPTLVNGQAGAALGNGVHESEKIIRVSALFLANPSSGYAQCFLDYLLFTEGSPLQP